MKAILKPVLAILASILIVLSMAALSTGSVRASSALPNASGNLPGEVDGYAYGGYLKVPSGFGIASVGPLFPAPLGCNITDDTVSATGASMHLGMFASSGAVTDTVTSNHTPTTADVHANSTVQSANILSGLITADNVTADAFSHATATAATSHGGATFVNLVVLGIPISVNPAPNTTITLPGLGSVVLNEQTGPINGVNHTSMSVNAIDVNVTKANTFKLPIGTHIIIAHANSSFTRTTVLAVVSARAYGLLGVAKVKNAFVKSGPWATGSLHCSGRCPMSL